jgi:hypothetical protein
MAIIETLEEELSLYQRLVARQTASESASDEPARSDIDEVASVGLFVIDRIRERSRVVSEAPNAGFSSRPDEERANLLRLYETWLSETRKLIERLLSLERRSISTAHGSELIKSFHEVNLSTFDAERVKQGMKDAIEGRVKPLREAADEFRRRRYGRSA